MSRKGTNWTTEEDEELLEGMYKFGADWEKIARGVIGRTT